MDVVPLRDKIIVKRVEAVAVSQGGIILPENAKEVLPEGEIVAVGSGRITEEGKIIELEVFVGDRVLFSKYSGTEIKVDGQDYLIMREDDVQCRFPRK